MPGVFTQSSNCWYGSAPARANPRTITAPRTVWATPATYGEPCRGWMAGAGAPGRADAAFDLGLAAFLAYARGLLTAPGA